MRYIIFTSLLSLTVATASEIKESPYMLGTGHKGQQRLDHMQVEPDRADKIVKNLLAESIEEAKTKIIATKLYDEEYLDNLLKKMNEHVNKDESHISMTDLFQVVAKKM